MVLKSLQMNSQVEEVKNKTDIVQIIGEHVNLAKAGTNYRGLCPFHNEKSPSFMVSPELQIYKCFGCGAGGDVFTFLEEYEGMSFPEALKYLADKANITLKPQKGQSFSSDKDKFYEINDLSAKFYRYIFSKHKEGELGRKYISERKLKEETIQAFEVGFAPSKPTALAKFLKTKYKFKDSDLVESGVVVRTERGLMDRFRGRIIFPIRDHRGKSIALAGRILPEYDTGKVGKYINSPETPIYHKSNSLFGINLSRSYIKRSGKVVVVEGEMDAISSWQAGIKNVVAIKGSALTEEQVIFLSRYAKNFILALDADFAGNSAAVKAISQAQEKGIDVFVAKMDPYKDPDEFAKADPEAYKKALEGAIGVWDFLIDLSVNRHGISDGTGKAAISREIAPLLADISDRIVRSHYIGLLAQKIGVSAEAVTEQVDSKIVRTSGKVKSEDLKAKQSGSRRELLEEKVLSIAFQLEPKELIDEKILELISSLPLKKIVEHFLSREPGSKDSKVFFDSLPAELKDKYSKLLLKEDLGETSLEKEYKMALYELELDNLRTRLQELAALISELEGRNEDEKLSEVEKEFQMMSKRLAQLQDRGI